MIRAYLGGEEPEDLDAAPLSTHELEQLVNHAIVHVRSIDTKLYAHTTGLKDYLERNSVDRASSQDPDHPFNHLVVSAQALAALRGIHHYLDPNQKERFDQAAQLAFESQELCRGHLERIAKELERNR